MRWESIPRPSRGADKSGGEAWVRHHRIATAAVALTEAPVAECSRAPVFGGQDLGIGTHPRISFWYRVYAAKVVQVYQIIVGPASHPWLSG